MKKFAVFLFIKTNLQLRANADVVGEYGGHSELTRKVAKHYDAKGTVVDCKTGKKEKIGKGEYKESYLFPDWTGGKKIYNT